MNSLKSYHYLTTARAKLFDWVRPLSPSDYTRRFDVGLHTLGTTLTHTMICEWLYMERIRTRGDWNPPPYETWPIQDETPPPFAELEQHWQKQAEQTRAIIEASLARGEWEREFEYRSTRPINDRWVIFSVSPADIFLQAYTHEIHHRAQAMYMLRQLGIPAQDLDAVYLTYKRREE